MSGICNVKTPAHGQILSPTRWRPSWTKSPFGVQQSVSTHAELRSHCARRRLASDPRFSGDDIKALVEAQQQQNMDKETANVSVFTSLVAAHAVDGAAMLEFDLKVAQVINADSSVDSGGDSSGDW
jgi:type II secretory pathway component PulK